MVENHHVIRTLPFVSLCQLATLFRPPSSPNGIKILVPYTRVILGLPARGAAPRQGPPEGRRGPPGGSQNVDTKCVNINVDTHFLHLNTVLLLCRLYAGIGLLSA